MTDNSERAPRSNPAPVFVPDFCDQSKRRLILIAAILASAMGFIDGTVVAIAMPAMRESLSASLGQAQWIANSYMLTLAALILVGGAFGDRFGLAKVFAAGVVVFVVASIACALATSPEFLIWARAIQGIGAAFMVPGSLAIISRTYPREERGRAIGIWAGASALTTALGPIIGGLALTFGGPETWRWIFAVNLPFGIITLWMLSRAISSDPSNPARGIDLPGSLLAVLGLGVLAWGLTDLGEGDGQLATMLLVVACISLTVFVWFEGRSQHPMMPLKLFGNRSFSAANLLTFTLYFGLSAMLFYLPMTVISAWGISEIEASAAFAPLSVFISALSAIVGRMSDRYGPGPMIAIGSAIVAVGYVFLGLTLAEQNFWGRVFPAMMVTGLGMAFVVGPLSTAVMASAPEEDTGTASGINNAVSRVAGLVAVALMGAILANAYAKSGGLTEFGAMGNTPDHAQASTAAFQLAVWITAALSIGSAAIAWLGIRSDQQV